MKKVTQLLFAVLIIAYQSVLQVNAQNSCSSGQYCSSGKFALEWDLVFFEGTIGLYQAGIAILQESTDVARQTSRRSSNAAQTTNTVRRVGKIVRIANSDLDWDGNTNTQEVQDGFFSPLLETSTVTPYPFFKGTVVPFKTCAYQYASWSDTGLNTKYYGFSRYMISIEYNTDTNLKQTMAYQDYYQVFTDDTLASTPDITNAVMDVFFQPATCSFTHFNGNRIFLKYFDQYNCDEDDPCDIDKPLIDSANPTDHTLVVKSFDLHSSSSDSQTVYGHAYVNGVWLFYMTEANDNTEFALYKTTIDRTASNDSTLGLTQIYQSSSDKDATLTNMVMFELRGVAIALEGVAGYIQITTDDDFATVSTSVITHPDNAGDEVKLIQQTGEEYLFRPVYAVWESTPERLHFVTLETDWTVYLFDTEDGVDMYNFDVVVTRYHLYNSLPGPIPTTDISALSSVFDDFRIAEYSLRDNAEIQQITFSFNECGDGHYIENEEGCDDGNNDDGDGCSSTCTVETDWTCDLTQHYDITPCTPDAVIICGNGVIDIIDVDTGETEECDLGTTRNSDDASGPTSDGSTTYVHGCSSTCTVNPGWQCVTASNESTCSVICGNMVLDTDYENINNLAAAETCDLGVLYIESEDKDGFNTNSDYADKTAAEAVQNPGCAADCTVKSGWRCPLDTYGTCTPYCGNGIMQGVITDLQPSAPISLGRDVKNDSDFDSGYPQWGGVVNGEPVWNLHDDSTYPMPVEQCDDFIYQDGINGPYTGDIGSHGCDHMCQIIAGWTCEHYLLKIETWEVPYYRSHCYETRRRRLSEDDDEDLEDQVSQETNAASSNETVQEEISHQEKYDILKDRRRRLDHDLVDPTAYYQQLPSEVITFAHNAQVINPTIGMNGRPRIISIADSAAVYGITYGVPLSGSNVDNVVTYDVVTISSATPGASRADADVANPTFAGRQRAVFGRFLVVNTALNQFEVFAYEFTDADNIAFSSLGTITTTYNLLGAFEFFWWPQLTMMLARLDDGLSVQMFNFPATIKDIFDNPGNYNDETKIDQTLIRPVKIRGQITVRPIFIGYYIIVLSTQTNGKAYFNLYKYNTVLMELIDMNKEVEYTPANNLYNKDGLVYFEDEDFFVVKLYGQSTFFGYTLDQTDASLTTASPSMEDTGSFGASITSTNVVLLQAQPDPDTTTYGDVYTYFDSTAIYKVVYDSGANEIQLTEQILLPSEYQLDIESGNIDIGHQHIAIMSKAQCDVVEDTDDITNPAVYYYTIAEDTWACVDLAATEATANSAWQYPAP